jgi:hypothetical protein
MRICRSETLRQGLTRRNGRAATSYQAVLRDGDLSLCADIRMLLKIILGRLRAAPSVRFRQSVPLTAMLGRNWDGAESRAAGGLRASRPSVPAQCAHLRAPAREWHSRTPAHTRAWRDVWTYVHFFLGIREIDVVLPPSQHGEGWDV